MARALALITLVARCQVLVFAERLVLPYRDQPAVPRSPTFWVIWVATLLSLVVVLMQPSAAVLFRTAAPSGREALLGVAAGLSAVGWRLSIRGFRRQT